MNRRQRVGVFAGILLITFMVTFPPMKGIQDRNFDGYGLFPGGCTYIEALDKNETRHFGSFDSTWKADTGWRCWKFDRQKLGFQVVIGVLLTSALFVLLGGKQGRD